MMLCAWCGAEIAEMDAEGLCPACEEQIASADTAWSATNKTEEE